MAGEGRARCAQVAETPHLDKLIGDAVPSTPAPRGHLLLKGLQQRPEEGCERGTPNTLPSWVEPPTFRSTVGGMRMSKPAAISDGTTLKETPPSSMVRLSEVTSPRVRLESDLSLGGRKGESPSATRGGGAVLPHPAATPKWGN